MMRALLLCLVCLGFAIGPARAGGFSESEPKEHFSPETIVQAAKTVEQALAERGARIALVFRSGRAREDLPEGISYTHGGFWVYTPIATDTGTVRGYAVYNLYINSETEGETSHLVQDFPVDFMAGAVESDVAVLIPSPAMQKRLLEIVFSERYAALHHKPYSLISNPHDARYQNCNEFMLDVTAAAVWQTDDRAQLKANLSEAFKPQDLDVGPLQRFLAPISNSTIKRDDHDGGFATTTYSSLRRFYEANGLAAEAFILPFAESTQGE